MLEYKGSRPSWNTTQPTPTTLPVSPTTPTTIPFSARKYDPLSLAAGIPIITRTLTVASSASRGSVVSQSGRLFILDVTALRVFDLATWTQLGSISLVDLESASAICYAPTTNRIYVTMGGVPSTPGKVKIIDPDSGAAGAIVGTLTLAEETPQGIVWVPSQNALFVTSDTGFQKITALTTTSGTVGGLVTTTDSGPVGICYCPANDRLYIAFPGTPSVRCYNVSTNAEVAGIAAGLTANAAQLAYCPANDRIYCVCYGTSNGVATSVCVINPLTQSVLTSIAVATYRPYGVCYNPQNGQIYVTVFGGGNALLIVNPANNTYYAAPETYPTIAAVQTVPHYIPHVGCVAVPCGNTSTLIVS